ncbi:MAG: DUF4296 domain-containing protein [Chitinophagaceae bacterium]|jgi:hypothetical protein|nr:DUF4296 domain-containing protein [Chitinophagaceae bacterium]
MNFKLNNSVWNHKSAKAWFCFFSIVLFVSCSSQSSKIIEPEEMKMIIWDMTKASELVSSDTSSAVRLNIKDSTTAEFQKVLAIHKTTEAVFLKSLIYYEQNPDKFKTIIDSTTAMAARLQIKLERDRHLRDSVKTKHYSDSLAKLHPIRDTVRTNKKDSLKVPQPKPDTVRTNKANLFKRLHPKLDSSRINKRNLLKRNFKRPTVPAI